MQFPSLEALSVILCVFVFSHINWPFPFFLFFFNHIVDIFFLLILSVSPHLFFGSSSAPTVLSAHQITFFPFLKSFPILFLSPTALWSGCPVAGWTNTAARANAFASPPCCTRTLRAHLCRTWCPRGPLPHHSPQWRIPTDQAAWPTSYSFSRGPWWSLCGGIALPGLSTSLWMPIGLTYRWASTYKIFTFHFHFNFVV